MTLKNIKNILFLLIFILLSNNLFGNGNGEFVDEKIMLSEDETMSISQTYDNGNYKYVITENNTSEVSNLIIEGNGEYFNSEGESLDKKILNEFLSDKVFSAEEVVQIHKRDLVIREANIKYIKDMEEKTINLLRRAKSMKEVSFSIPTGLNDIEYTIYSLDDVNRKLNSYTITITPNFFPGERAFFDYFFNEKGKILSDYQKRVLFMSTFFCENGLIVSNDESNDFMKLISVEAARLLKSKKIDEQDILNLRIGNYIKKSSLLMTKKLKIHQELFKRAFISHFKINIDNFNNPESIIFNGEFEAPYLDIDSESFNALYGTGIEDSKYRSDYLFTYLVYSKNRLKPFLSYIINKNLNEGILNNIKYNFKSYREINEVEGEKIAKSALKYMTWGVEYTALVKSELENNMSNSEVFQENRDQIEKWVYSKNISKNNKSSNYLNPKNVKTLVNSLNIPTNSDFKKLYEEGYITTPFVGSDGKAISGNPIAYSPLGTDTPKSFNYKLYEQQKVKKWMYNNSDYNYQQLDINSTLANDKYGNDLKQLGYITEIDLYRDYMKKNGNIQHIKINSDNLEYNIQLPNLTQVYSALKPYITYHPLMESRHNLDYMYSNNSMFNINKLAGVDSIGLLAGSLALSFTEDTTLLNVFNQNVIKNIDTYNYNLNPLFHNSTNSDHIRMRLNKSDIERSTILLPDLSQARKGDLLVNFTKDYPHVGIIIEADFSGLPENPSTEEYMKRIKVISTKNGYRMANIGTWHNKGNVFSGFTKKSEEKNYHLRRLVVIDKPSSADDKKYVKDKLEFFDVEYLALNIDLNIKNNYIPNTGELLEIQSIDIKADLLSDGNDDPENIIELDKKSREIIILSPIDMYRIPSSENDSNIFNNKGAGLKFYAIDPNYGAICLATFKLNDNLAVFDESPYDITYNNDIFNSKGNVKSGFELYVNNNNKLTFKYKLDKKEVILTKFGVRPIYPHDINSGEPFKVVNGEKKYFVEEQIKLGDDFLLRFALKNNLSVQGIASDNDFLEIYNKKLIWTSNLFKDRRERFNIDWNEDYPWNAPPKIDIEMNWGTGPRKDHPEYSKYEPHYRGMKFFSIKFDEIYPDNREHIWYGENRLNFAIDEINKYNLVMKYVSQQLEYSDVDHIQFGNGKQTLLLSFNNEDPDITVTYTQGIGWRDARSNEYIEPSILFNGLGPALDYDRPIKNYSKYKLDGPVELAVSSIAYIPTVIGKFIGAKVIKDYSDFDELVGDTLKFMNGELDPVIKNRLMYIYYNNLNKNYKPRSINGKIINNILPYLLKDENENVYTRSETREAILNSNHELGFYLYKKGWRIEAADTFHENGYPCVKLLHVNGGEQIYNMKTGEIVTDDLYLGTYNVYPGPYGDLTDKGEPGRQARLHGVYDVVTWILWGGTGNDLSTETERLTRFREGGEDYWGHPYQWPSRSGLPDAQIIELGGILPKLRIE